VDSVTRIDETFQSDIEFVAGQLGLDHHWLNHNAQAFKPVGLDYERCELFYENETLRVFGPHVDDIFIMKLNASRKIDIADMVSLWPEVTFQTAAEVVERHTAAYPADDTDEHLEEFVQTIIDQTAPKPELPDVEYDFDR
jgi:hypothetical protein